MLNAIADILGVETGSRNLPLIVKLQKYIQSHDPNKMSPFYVFIIDDAHLVERESLLDICSLMVNPNEERIASCFILVGDDSLHQKLKLKTMASVRNRLIGLFEMKVMDHSESLDFIKFRLKNAEAPDDLFDQESLYQIVAHCKGNKRRIMNMCTLLLNEAYFRQEKTVSSELIFSCEQIEISE